MSSFFDYKNITKALIAAIKQSTGYLLIEGNSNGDQPPYPFCTYSVISPRIDSTRDTDNANFEIVVSLTWHDTSSISVLNLSNLTKTFFESTNGRFFFRDRDIVIVDVTLDGARDNFISIDYERMAGLDVKLCVTDTFSDFENVGNITDITINGGNE